MKRFLVSLGLLAVLTGATVAQPPAPPAEPGKAAKQDGQQGAQDVPLNLQKQAFEKFETLKKTMDDLQKLLVSSEPERAKRLRAGLTLLNEKRVDDTMRDIEKLLGDQSWSLAIEKIEKVTGELNNLLSLLMDREVDLQKLLEEIARLEDFKKKVEDLIGEQKQEKEASAAAEALERQLKDIERAKAEAKRLLEEQKKLKADTEKRGSGDKEAKDLADKQKELKADAEGLESDLKNIEAQAKELSEQKAGEGKGEGKGEGEGEGKGEGQGSGSGAGGSGSAGKAAESMGKSQQKLSDNKPEPSLDDQEKAIQELEKTRDALDELEEEAKKRLMELPFERFTQEQLQTMEKTEKLAEEMEKAGKEGEGDGKGEGKPTPGQDNVEQAVPKQKNAAGSLKEVKPGKAKPKQQDAQDDLEEAKKKLEDALAQLRQELHEEVLRALEERFTAMLAKQRELTRETALIQAWRGRVEALVKDGVIPAAVKDRCHRVGEGEQDLRVQSQSALTLIEAEGSSAVLLEVVRSLGDDFGLVAGRLDGYDSGDETIAFQKQIEKTLEQLLDALTRRIEQHSEEGG